jgi:hypothetical protein
LTVAEVATLDELRLVNDRFHFAILHGNVPLDITDTITAAGLPCVYFMTQAPDIRPLSGPAGPDEQKQGLVSEWFSTAHCLCSVASAVLPSERVALRLQQELRIPEFGRWLAMGDKPQTPSNCPAQPPGALILISDGVPGEAVEAMQVALRGSPRRTAIRALDSLLSGDKEAVAFLEANEHADLVHVHVGASPTLKEETAARMAYVIGTRYWPRRLGTATVKQFTANPEGFFDDLEPPRRLDITNVTCFIKTELKAAVAGAFGLSGSELCLIRNALRVAAPPSFVTVRTVLPQFLYNPPEPFQPSRALEPPRATGFYQWNRHLLTGLPLAPPGRELWNELREQVYAAERFAEEWHLRSDGSAARRNHIRAGLHRIDELEQMVRLKDAQLVRLAAALHTSESMVDFLQAKVSEIESSEMTDSSASLGNRLDAIIRTEEALR